MSEPSIDFVSVVRRYDDLSTGYQAQLRRACSPYDLTSLPAFYRLFPGIKTNTSWQRVVYFLPFVKHAAGESLLGEQLAAGKVSEQRLFQVIRSNSPNDLIQLRRLVQQVEPRLDWQKFGETLFYWNDQKKRRLLENYFLHLPAPKKDHKS